MKKIANSIHHTHWDLIWYFTTQDASVQLAYNMKELLRGFKEGKINNFFFDGQTTPFDEYLQMHPEDEAYIKELVTSGKLVVGPFNSQLDCFISSGESVINNLKLGFKTAERLGKVSKIAYLPDSFGHSLDFPKIFNKFGIKDFVIKRGVGDEYGLDSEFNWKSKDGSELLVFTMIAGYGYGCYAFKEKTLFTDDAVDYNKIKVDDLIDRIVSYSSLEDDFIFLLGFDQNPAILNVDELIEYHNENQDNYTFVETTWADYMEKIRKSEVELKTHKHEIFSTQYHRVHRSIFSARSDIKAMQDKVERILTYQVQPYMVLLDSLGIPYDQGLVYKAWETLVLCQTHSSANLTNETNEYIRVQTNNALNLANSMVDYLNKLVTISMEEQVDSTPLLIVNTLPFSRDIVSKTQVFTKSSSFNIKDENGNNVPFTILSTEKKNNGVLRKEKMLINNNAFYYVHNIVINIKNVPGIGYQTLSVVDGDTTGNIHSSVNGIHFIENEYYKIFKDENGISLYDKQTNEIVKNVIHLQDGGDEGDSFDYSYPTNDWVIKDQFENAQVNYEEQFGLSTMTLTGDFLIPKTLQERKMKCSNSRLHYEIKIQLTDSDKVVRVHGTIENEAEDHRVRLIFKGKDSMNSYSYAGTQYGYITRETNPEALKYWKEDGWFEEPSPTYPLLNHVSSVTAKGNLNVHTRSSKEYECISETYADIAVTLFRSYGALGYPDLNRRPGRPGGLDYMIFETSDSQMIGKNTFDLGFSYDSNFDGNNVRNEYIKFAADPIIYHKQEFDKSIHAIQYFPTNPWWNKLPSSHKLLSMDDFKGSFGTIVKEDDNYILRVYNNEEKSIDLSCELHSLPGYKMVDTDLINNDKDTFEKEIHNNELRIVKIRK